MSQINFKDETLDASDGVTKLLLLAAEYWKEKASALRAKITEMEQQEPVQPAPIEQDTSVRKAWARFSNELHRSPDAPYPGMSEAFEKHFSQSFTDREWRAESGVWAAAWKAAKNHGAQPAPSVPDGWLRAIDESLVVANIGVANPDDTYEQAKAKLDNLIGFHVDVATDPAVNGGWKLVPRPPTPTMVKAGLESSHVLNVHRVLACYDAMIDAAPEAKR